MSCIYEDINELRLSANLLPIKSLRRLTLSRLVPSSPQDLHICHPKRIPYLYCNKIYKFQCQCDADYIERTIQRLEVGVKQRVPQELLRQSQYTSSAIVDHLADHYICWTDFSDDYFSVFYKAKSKQHLAFWEAMAILLYCPTLCRERRQFNIFCQFWELGGNHESWGLLGFFFNCTSFSTPFKRFWCILLKTRRTKGSPKLFSLFWLSNKYDPLTFGCYIYIYIYI